MGRSAVSHVPTVGMSLFAVVVCQAITARLSTLM